VDNNSKTNLFRRFEYILLIVCLCVLCFRATSLEAPHIETSSALQKLSNDGFSLITSGVILFVVIAWVLGAVFSKKVHYRFSGIEVGVLIFFMAGVVSIIVASNKRTAITDMVTLISPMLMAVLLVQLLDRPIRIKILLMVVIALGVTSTYKCFDQNLSGNDDTIEMYEQDPEKYLQGINIVAGSFNQMLFEHMLYSKDIRGFLVTGNSAGSFALLALFTAIAMLIEKFKAHRQNMSLQPIVFYSIGATVVVVGLVLTRSKSAIIGTFLAAVMLGAYLCMGKLLGRYRRVIVIMILLMVVVAGVVVVKYGVSHGDLPGGNSMLVRWQYWQSAVRMYADRPLTGVGGGNFASYYTHYKIPSALETVLDPHNFLLSLLSQYGPLGLIGFLAAIFAVLYKTVFARHYDNPQEIEAESKLSGRMVAAVLLSISAALLVFRPFVLPSEMGSGFLETFFIVLMLYITPVAVIVLVFWFLWGSEKEITSTCLPISDSSKAALFCGVTGVAIAGVVDFAIFEPAVLTLMFVMVSVLAAMNVQTGRGVRTIVFSPGKPARLAVSAGGVIIVWVFLSYALMPPVKAGAKIQSVRRGEGNPYELLYKAAADDPLNPKPLNLSGQFYIQRYLESGQKQPELLNRAVDNFTGAILRDPSDFKNYKKLSEIYIVFARNSSGDEATGFCDKAYEYGCLAAKRYPGFSELQLELGKLAEKLDRIQGAKGHYEKAVTIEDSYREQFCRMYPGKEIFSRLGDSNYQFAKDRLAVLSN